MSSRPGTCSLARASSSEAGAAIDIHDLKQAQEALQVALKTKDDFVGFVSHELLRAAYDSSSSRSATEIHWNRGHREVIIEAEVSLAPVLPRQGWIEQILTNLLSNADRYSPPGTPIEILVKACGRLGLGPCPRPRPRRLLLGPGLRTLLPLQAERAGRPGRRPPPHGRP